MRKLIITYYSIVLIIAGVAAGVSFGKGENVLSFLCVICVILAFITLRTIYKERLYEKQ